MTDDSIKPPQPFHERTVIGGREWCTLPELHIPAIRARIDSGAATSCLNAANVSIEDKDGTAYVHFTVQPLSKHPQVAVACSAPLHEIKGVKSSNGSTEWRPVIETLLHLDGAIHKVQLTLTNRSAMTHSMLLGREAMKDHFLVAPDQDLLLGKCSKVRLEKLYHTDLSSEASPAGVTSVKHTPPVERVRKRN